MRIRSVRRDELPALQAIERAAGEAFRGRGMAQIADDEPPTVEALHHYREEGLAWVAADREDAPVAYLVARLVDGCLHIEQVSVHPAHAGRRIGRTLLDHASRWAECHGVPALTLSTFASVPWNAPYYRRLGFRPIDTPALGPGLVRIRAEEESLRLTRWPRVFMRREVGPRD
ncbi:GCN5 family acetyltransferase [Sinomonas atrocyanea]|uniref:GCN5 family acetyltransferase n=2 Tax=Sinomonas atrocyanea TaxID=37927 RepID=A0A127A6Q9_9MICC|nr:GCN5 family acetyltransferase [Sinomonas atrocyanea]GEB66655.1 GCN5 family N-acetyltransferase [Sinomonas atrocyanea]GGG78805.1 GCN5 family N-acetyltransferase [Sinomonas atrocyanea]